MRKPGKRARKEKAAPKRNIKRWVKLPSETAKAAGVDRVEVVVLAEPSRPLVQAEGWGEFKRGVYLYIRNGATNSYAVIDTQLRQIGNISNVPERASGWSRINDRGEPHAALMDLVLYEAYWMLSRWDPQFKATPEELRCRAIYRGMAPYGGTTVTHEGTLARDTDNYDSRGIEVVRGNGAVTVQLEYLPGRNDIIDLTIGGNRHRTGRGIAEFNAGSPSDDGTACFFVSDIQALEQLHSALGTAIVRAKEGRWPMPAR